MRDAPLGAGVCLCATQLLYSEEKSESPTKSAYVAETAQKKSFENLCWWILWGEKLNYLITGRFSKLLGNWQVQCMQEKICRGRTSHNEVIKTARWKQTVINNTGINITGDDFGFKFSLKMPFWHKGLCGFILYFNTRSSIYHLIFYCSSILYLQRTPAKLTERDMQDPTKYRL